MDEKERLAIDGGKPVRERLLPYGRQQVAEEDIQAVVNVLRSDWLTTGPNIEEFENAVAARVGAKYAAAFSSGTAALHGAVFAAGLGKGDEAITSPLTFAATANCLLYQGATPIFADVCADTLTIDPNEILKQLTPRTKAILPVDFAGHPADMDAIQAIARERNLVVIEDAAHALGGMYHERPVGSIADMTMFSFHPVKHITTGEGGIITTNDAGYYERLKLFRNHGINSDARKRQETATLHPSGQAWFYEMVALGYNYRLTDIGAVLGLSQLKRLDANLARRREIAAHYSSVFAEMDEIVVPHVRAEAEPAWHLYPIQVSSEKLKAKNGRAEIFRALRAENIGVNVHYIPVHLHPYYRERFGYVGGEYPIAEHAYAGLISLPMFHGMTDEDVRDVVRAVEKVIGAYAKE